MPDSMLMIDPEVLNKARGELNTAAGNIAAGVSAMNQAEPEAQAIVKALSDLNVQIADALRKISEGITGVENNVSHLSTADRELLDGMNMIRGPVAQDIELGSKGRGSTQMQTFLSGWNGNVAPLENSIHVMGATSQQMQSLLSQLQQTTARIQDELTQLQGTSQKLLTNVQDVNVQLKQHEQDLQSAPPALQNFITRLEGQDTLNLSIG